jgi:hypothetical protein
MTPPEKETLKIPDATTWAMKTAQRLRHLQAGLAEEKPLTREEYLSKELLHLVNPLPPTLRRTYLDALAQYFPTWEMATVSFDQDGDAPRPQTIDELVNALLKMIPRLSPEQRDEVIDRFEQAGVVKLSPSPLAGEGLAAVQKVLQIRAESPVDGNRVGHVFATMLQTTLTLYQLVDEIWRKMAPASRVRLGMSFADFRTFLADALAGDKYATPEAVNGQTEKARHLIAAILSAADMTGSAFATYFEKNLSPTAIREEIRVKGKVGLLDNREARAWEHYALKVVHLNRASLERLIRKELVETAETLASQEPANAPPSS